MKGKSIFYALLFGLILSSCAKSDNNCQTALPNELANMVIAHQMKGWELYSWPGSGSECDDWNYVLLPGTNRVKTVNEVTSDQVQLRVVGKEQLKSLLSKLQKDEYISWVSESWLTRLWGQSYQLRLPPFSTQNEIKQHAVNLGLNFSIVD